MKYKLIGNLYADYQKYLAQEGIYTVLFGHKPKGYRKAEYIWKALINQQPILNERWKTAFLRKPKINT